ncbi:MAG: hypothetical protein JW909_02230, partial [Planctomycetes bacterium]|nr:hypothetical protein [Planctomycetota bacterium]
LGGWLAALAGMVFEPDYLFLISPAVAPERVFQHSPIFARRRAEAERSEWGMEGFVEGIRQVSPMFSDPLIPGNAVRIMSGRYDEVIPYNDVLDFTRVWETQAIVPIEHGHFSMMYLYPDLFTDVCRELKKLINGLPHREQDE